MINTKDILETISMIEEEHLDVRTITMGISLLDCAAGTPEETCENIYNKITTYAKDLVKANATYKPNPANKAVYDKNFEVFKQLYKANKKNFSMLNG